MAAATEFQFPPRFFKVFVSLFSSDSMVIPIPYDDHLPRLLPKKVILQGPGGRSWNVATEIRGGGDEVHFAQGWPKFVEDNTLNDGDFLTFVYNGNHIFEVSIFRSDGCKETSEVFEVSEDEGDSVCSLSSDNTETRSKPEMENPIPQGTDKGKSKVELVEDSDEDEDSVYSESSEETETESDSGSEFRIGKTTPKRKNKGKKKDQEVVPVEEESSEEDGDGDSDSDYIEAFGQLAVEDESNSEDSSYAPEEEDTAASTTCVKAKVANLKRKDAAKKRKKVDPKIKNPETYLDDPKNIHFETNVKNRLYELLVHAQLVKDYCLRFGDYVDYIDRFGKLRAKTAKWKDQRVCIKRWMRICKRNRLTKEDRVLCELLRRGSFVYAIKLHVVRGKNL
ncbi:PREDICTED: B3 domain-containing protein At4g34400-like [Camelina sativa]|uniref:B3 domain-containing protein At4g34400-like n=1 Tax=Camelina sativa TaxID=90675 RepID=A0ABM0VSW1_CAMSA|nr:PREDICTED: B3 domain-containing protein At4g34400-like [Camelina sativa]